jgi:UDP-glucose 4-epimerase
MKVFVTGSQGAIGRWVVKRLLEAGHTIRTFDIQAQSNQQEWEHIPGDIRDLTQVRKVMQGMEAVIHLAAIPSDFFGIKEQIMDTNLRGTWNVLLACEEVGIERMVYFSSINALGHAQPTHTELYLPMDDDIPHHPVSAYELTKHLSEEMCTAFSKPKSSRDGNVTTLGMKIVSLRPTMVLLPDNRRMWWSMMPEETRIMFTKNDFWSYVDVRDVSEAALLGLTVEIEGHQAFLLTADDILARQTSAEMIEKFCPHVPWKVNKEAYLAVNPYRTLVDCSKAKRLLGWQPRYSVRDPSSGISM